MPNDADDVADEGLVEEGVTHHGGAAPRGLMAVPKSRLFEGRFGRMFRNLPIPWPPREALIALGEAMPEERRPRATADNTKIPAAYTYLGLTTAELELSKLRLKAAHRTLLEQDTPLWFYVLKEAEVRSNGERLGPVGARIVAEVLIGVLQGDPNSFLSMEPGWTPEGIPAKTPGEFTLADLLTFATR